jgi:predicted transcriptional regulator
MGQINIADIRPGMVLATDVRDRNSRVLLTAGNELTDKHIKIFKMWGVTEADIQGVAHEDVEAQEAAALDPELLRKADLVTQELFTHAGSEHSAIKELVRLSTMRRVRTLMEAANGH